MIYQCPLCGSPLSLQNHVWQCGQHHFDCAKEGYVNLIPVQHKRSKNPGDSQEMMQARRQFLDSGFYQPLRHELSLLIEKSIKSPKVSILDIGCGEGYYTAGIEEYLSSGFDVNMFGLDIAKVAIRYAAKRYKKIQFCVASSQRLPFIDQSVDIILRIYAPCNEQELQRVVTDQGFVITVTPGEYHLRALKELIYPFVKLHDNIVEEIEGFKQINRQNLKYSVNLSGEQAFCLLQMTPFFWRASNQVKEQIMLLNHFHCEIDFIISLHQKI